MAYLFDNCTNLKSKFINVISAVSHFDNCYILSLPFWYGTNDIPWLVIMLDLDILLWILFWYVFIYEDRV